MKSILKAERKPMAALSIKNRYFLANPTKFLKLTQPFLWPLFFLSLLLGVGGVVWGLKFSPIDYQQGDTVRIMYVHVPAAWMALFIYSFIAGCSVVSLIWRHPLCDLLGVAAAPVGMAFTLISLITGALWGKPMWGAWWVWDARLTSVLILLLLYLGYMFLVSAFKEWGRGLRAAAFLSIIGLVNLPIIKWSVDWWNTLHQPASIMRLGGPKIHSAFLGPLYCMAFSFLFLFLALLLIRLRVLLFVRKLQVLKAHEHYS